MIVQAVKARYDETRWLEVARTLNDPLRAERRDALVAYLLPRMRDLGVTNRSQLFEYFRIDVDMNPCMLTSRIRQATGAVQTRTRQLSAAGPTLRRPDFCAALGSFNWSTRHHGRRASPNAAISATTVESTFSSAGAGRRGSSPKADGNSGTSNRA